jgi:SAM-dependent methyltransferase
MKVLLVLVLWVNLSHTLVLPEKCFRQRASKDFVECLPESVLSYISNFGWKSSELIATVDQRYKNSPCLYQGNCNQRGENLLGMCFCLPGWEGSQCQDLSALERPECTNRDDRCFYTTHGVWSISNNRWAAAQEAEGALWSSHTGNTDGGDRVEEHMIDFDRYRSVGQDGSNLGLFMEVGAGPWTQSLYMIRERKFRVERYVVLEPNAITYAHHTSGTPYRTGDVEELGKGKTVIINAGAEHLDLMVDVVDTLMIVNVLEHVQNVITILRNVYNALKVGGILIFNDRWWDNYRPGETMDLDTLYHPIRLKKSVILQFLSGFDRVYEIRDQDSKAFRILGRNFNGTYFIGRKKSLCT